MSTARDFREMTEADLQRALNEAKAELFNLRFQKEVGQLTNTARIKEIRRNIARIKTVLRERQIAAQLVKEQQDAK